MTSKSGEPPIGQDEGTQQMLRKAQENFPGEDRMEALQKEANQQEGREARTGEGQASGVVDTIKQKASEAVEAVKEMNPATRNYVEPRD